MACDRDAIFQALVARLSSIEGLASPVSDRLIAWSQVAPSEQPKLLAVKAGEQVTQDGGKPPIWDLGATLYLYVHAQNLVDVSPQRKLNQLLTRIEACLEALPAEGGASISGGVSFATTLGGLVKYARIEGEVQTDEGTLDDQTVAVIRVVMRATG